MDDFLNKDEDDVVDASETQENPKHSTKKHHKPKARAVVDSDTEVITLTDVNVKDVLNTPHVDVFVEFFAPWCGHCQMLAPELSETARAFQEVRKFLMYFVFLRPWELSLSVAACFSAILS